MRAESILVTICALALAGCGKQEAAPGQTGVAPSDFGAPIGDISNKGSAELVKTLESQANQYQSQLDTLKSQAASVTDDQLNQLISTLDQQLKTLSAKLKEIQTADEGSIAALQKEVQSLMGDVGKLMQQAQQRLAAAGG